MDAGHLLEALARTVERLGSYTDADLVPALVRDLVREIGLEGAALWRARGPRLVLAHAEGKPIDDAFAREALSGERDEGARAAWPLRVRERTIGVLAVRGALEEPVRLVARMLAGRSAHVLQDAERASTQRTLLEGLSHELRAPLQALLGYVDLLRAGGFGLLTDAQAQALDTVSQSAEKVLAVARDVLQVARIDAGRDHVIVGEVALDELLAREVEDVRPLAAAAGLRLDLSCPEGLRLRSDGAKIARIVTNLLSNAIKYTGEGGVTVQARAAEHGCVIEVLDTGAGIPEDKREAVFEEYVRLDRSREGTGLGLPIARRLAGLLGGRLDLLPREGGGTAARLELPPCGG